MFVGCSGGTPVALLTEGVDRNKVQGYEIQYPGVALLTEGVDRNPV